MNVCNGVGGWGRTVEVGEVGVEAVGVGGLGSGVGVEGVGGGGVVGVEVWKVVVLVSNRPRVKSSLRQIVMYPWAFGANEHFGQMGVWDKWA